MRIIRACKSLGARSVAIYVSEDSHGAHVRIEDLHERSTSCAARAALLLRFFVPQERDQGRTTVEKITSGLQMRDLNNE